MAMVEEVVDEEAYQRFRERLRTTYAHLTSGQAVWFGARDLASWGNEAIAEGDVDTAGRLHYCFSRLEADWAAYVASGEEAAA